MEPPSHFPDGRLGCRPHRAVTSMWFDSVSHQIMKKIAHVATHLSKTSSSYGGDDGNKPSYRTPPEPVQWAYRQKCIPLLRVPRGLIYSNFFAQGRCMYSGAWIIILSLDGASGLCKNSCEISSTANLQLNALGGKGMISSMCDWASVLRREFPPPLCPL